MRITKKKKIAVAGLVIAGLVSGGSAYAYWTAGGAGDGLARTGNAPGVTIEQLSVLNGVAPGAPAQDIEIKITNPSATTSQFVNEVAARIDGVELAAGHAPGTCDETDFTLSGPLAIGHEFLANEVQTYTGLTIAFNNKATNQDACKGAVLYLAYQAS
jgi:hypothetical protein